MNPIEKDSIFGIKEAPNFSTDGLELRYKSEHGQEGEACYLRERVYRDESGNYFLEAKGGADATISLETEYYLDGREVLIPICPEALVDWAAFHLHGEECMRALEEFEAPKYTYEKVWLYAQGVEANQQGYIYEFLWKVSAGFYVLFSTDNSYPCIGRNIPYAELFEGGICRDDLYIYPITPETARRWAEARGMGETACQMVFGR